MSAVLIVIGALAIICGASLIYWPFGVVTFGVLALAAGVDLRPRGSG